jgi:glycosyltransferase involved in cell wall biosynthesis
VQAVPSIIADGEAGFVLPPGEGAAAYVKRLIPVIEDRSQYRRMAHAARRRYEEKLNWMAFAAGVVKTIEASL